MDELEKAQAELKRLREGVGPGPVWGSQDLESYTEAELAPRLKVTRQTLRNWRKKGIGPPFKRIGRNVRYPHQLFIAWLSKQG